MNFAGTEVYFSSDDLIVSKTDLKGHITYANHTFLDIAGYDEDEVIGQAHNLIRNDNMPRGIFEYFWQTIGGGQEIFAYVVNSTKNGDHYWVIAHVTASYKNGQVVGYHSTRRKPDAQTITGTIIPLYDELNRIETGYANRKEGIQHSVARLQEILDEKSMNYGEFISTLTRKH